MNSPFLTLLDHLFEAELEIRQISGSGTHKHQCGDCQHVFEHSDACKGDVLAHFCPECGGGPWSWRLS